MNEVFFAARNATITAIKKYRHFFDRKAHATPLAKHRYCLLLNPKLSSVTDHICKSLAKWLPLYRVEQVLANSNYINRKVGTNYTHCIRLTPVNLQFQVEELAQVRQNIPDPSTRHTSEPSLFDSTLLDFLFDKSFTPTDEITVAPSTLFDYTPRRVPPPAAPAAPLLVHQPPVVPLLNQAPPQDDFNELPVNSNFTLDDLLNFLTRTRTPSRIYSSSDLNSSNSFFWVLKVKHCPERIVVSIDLLIDPKVVQHTPP